MTRLALVTALVAAILLTSTAYPTPVRAQALSAAETACRDTIAKTQAKYAKLAFSMTQRCHQRRSSGDRSLSDNCNDVAEADTGGKLVRTRAKAAARIVDACNAADSLLAQYPACPAPADAIDDGGATTGIDDFDELSRCLTTLVESGVGDASLDAMGSPNERMLQALISCQKSLGRGVGGLVRAYLEERRKCQHDADGGGGAAEYSCDDTDPRGKIARAQAKLADLVFRACDFIPQQELMKLNACSDTAGGLADCAQASGDIHGAELIRDAYVLPDAPTTTTTTTTLPTGCGSSFPQCDGACAPGDFCQNTGTQCECVAGTGPCAPATLLRHLNARYGTPGSLTQLSTGWTGKTHIVDVPDDSFDAIDLTCDGNCENCSVSLNKRIGDETSNCRCAADPRTTCTAINGADSTNCSGLDPTCTCYFGPGLAISSGGTPVCVLNQIREDYTGSINLRLGEFSDVIKLSSLVHLGISQFAPCPTCDNDTTAGDGVRDGTCNGGLQNGQTCDTNGTHLTFGPTSFDCPPASSSNISGSGLQIDLHLQSGSQSLTAALPCDAPAGQLCPCRVCSGNSQLGCTSDAECAAASAGTCTAGGDVPIQPNQCTDGVCSAQGLCEAGPVDKYCDGALHADGRGFVSCTTDIDCGALGAGTCTVLDLRRCFPDPITVTGSADIYNPVTGAIFCIPPTTNIAVNQTAGLPGPGTIQLDSDIDVRCQSDPNLVYQFPAGANCPDLVTTTTTTTTTVTLPVPACDSATFPACGGTCPVGQTCTPTLVNTCACTGL